MIQFHHGYCSCCWSISARDCSIFSGNLTRPNCALNKMLLICNFANCLSLIPRISFNSLATCRPNISSASMSSEVPLADPFSAEWAADRGVCFSLLVTRTFTWFTRELLECFWGTNVQESVDDSDTSSTGGDADMPLSILESSSALEALVCTNNIENTTITNERSTNLQVNHSYVVQLFWWVAV